MGVVWKDFEASFVSNGKLVPSFRLLLQPIDRRVPLASVETWRKQLREAQQDLSSAKTRIEPGVKTVVEGITANLLQALKVQAGSEGLSLGPDNPWGSAVALLTASTLIAPIGGIVEPTALDAVWPRTSHNLPEAIADILGILYHGLARQKPAGPLAFYELSQVALLNRGLFASVFGKPVGSYLGLLKGFVDNGYSPQVNGQVIIFPPYSADDRCMHYLIDRMKDKKAGAPSTAGLPSYPAALKQYIESQARPAFSLLRKNRKTLDKVRIVFLGESRAGKSTIVKQLFRAISAGIDIGIVQPNKLKKGWDATQAGYASQTIVPIVPLEAKYSLRNGSTLVPCEIIDHKGGILSDPRETVDPKDLDALAEQTGDCDLVIVVLPADQFEVSANHDYFMDLLQTYVDLVGRIIQNNPFCMIAIAYSKCDEFGVSVGSQVRIIDGNSGASSSFESFTRFRRAAPEDIDAKKKLWRAFVDSASSDRTSTEVSELRRFLLNYTATLWTQIARIDRREHALMNGYLVSALPAEAMDDRPSPSDYVRGVPQADITDRGFLQIFADFAAYMESVWSRA
jgi:hypothetical protein